MVPDDSPTAQGVDASFGEPARGHARGWVVIEDFDNMFLSVGSAAMPPEQAVVRKVALAFKRLLQDRGADLAYAGRLPDLFAPAD